MSHQLPAHSSITKQDLVIVDLHSLFATLIGTEYESALDNFIHSVSRIENALTLHNLVVYIYGIDEAMVWPNNDGQYMVDKTAISPEASTLIRLYEMILDAVGKSVVAESPVMRNRSIILGLN